MYTVVTTRKRGVDGGLGVEALVDKPRDELDVALGLHEGAHDAEGADEAPVPEEQPWDDCVEGTAPGSTRPDTSKPAARFWRTIPVPGGTTREPKWS